MAARKDTIFNPYGPNAVPFVWDVSIPINFIMTDEKGLPYWTEERIAKFKKKSVCV